MKGFITDSELQQADTEFPGIAAFFEALLEKPGTFLELVGQFEHWGERRLVRTEWNPSAALPREDEGNEGRTK